MGEGSGVAMNCGIGRRHNSDLALLRLWYRPAAAAPIQPLAWKRPYTVDAALTTPRPPKKTTHTKNPKQKTTHSPDLSDFF